MPYKLILLLCFIPALSFAQKLPSVEEKTNGLKKYDGFMDFYWDEANGKIWLDINKLDSEMLYLTSLPAGLGSNDIGLDRGKLGHSRIVKFKRVGRKVMMIEPNYNYRAVTQDKAEQRAVELSFAQSTLWGFTVEAESNGHLLVDATDFMMRDVMQATNVIREMKQGNFSLDKSRSAIYIEGTKNFPLNTEMEASLTFVNTDGQVGDFVSSVAPSPEAFTVRMHHSFVQLPDSDYQPRVFDPRSSFFGTSYFDYSTPVSEPIRKYLISRHRLKKKDPQTARSEAVKPIVYYLDAGTPEPIRSALMEGAKWWNQAFEAAGYINAFQVKLLPADADPMDIRYNMINWVHRSTRGWSYGEGVVDPRTGEIIKGNVTLGSLRVRQDYLIAQGILAPFENGMPAEDKMLKMALARLSQLAAHEVGHTLGLMHNYAASVSNRASVMDYPHPAISLNTAGQFDLSDAYAKGIGEWDKIAITWGYSDLRNTSNEKEALDNILKSAAVKGYQFISDRDANSPGGLHPFAHLWDNGKSAVEELRHVMKVREKALSQFGENNIRPGQAMSTLEDVLVPVYLYHRYQITAATKLVGGLNYTYALRGDGQLITKPLSKEEQLKALEAILDCIDPKALALPETIIKLIPPQPEGYYSSKEQFRKRTGIAFDALSPAETAADLPFSFLFNSARLNRLVEFKVQYGGLGLDDMIKTILDRTWMAPRRKGMEGLIQMQTEQIILTYLLSSSVDESTSFISRGIINKTISDLKKFIEARSKSTTDITYAGHLLLALERMKAPEKARPTLHSSIPPGAPIGCDSDQ
jgi:hypothetical protein